jgi:hypothetical protein
MTLRRTHTHSYAILKVSEACYEEIRKKLDEAGYHENFHPNDEAPASPLIDMHGIALAPEVEQEGQVNQDGRQLTFKCKVCSVDCPIAPDPPGQAVCEEHCEDHEYAYDPWRRGSFCVHCDKQREESSDD